MSVRLLRDAATVGKSKEGWRSFWVGGWELTGSAAVLRLRILCARQELGVLNKRVGLAQI